MTPRLEKAVRDERAGSIPFPLSLETKEGGMAVLSLCILDMDGHTRFPPRLTLKLTVFDAMGDIVSEGMQDYKRYQDP